MAKIITKHEATQIPSAVQHFDSLPNIAFVRLPTVAILFGCSPATIWRGVKNGTIPAPEKVGPRITGWRVGKLRQALTARTAQ